MPLTKTAIAKAQPRSKQYKLADFNGLYVLVTRNGKKYFRFNYRTHKGKSKTLALGVFPEVTIEEARERLKEAKKLLTDGIDPSEYKKQKKLTQFHTENTFEAIAREWFAKKVSVWVPSHARTVISRLENDVFPVLGSRPINEITAPDVLFVLRQIENRGAIETAHRAKRVCGQIFRYGISTGRCQRDHTADLKDALTPIKIQHRAAITNPSEVGALLRTIDNYKGSFVVKAALRLAPLVFVRPGELRHAEWAEIDFERSEWRIPAHKMKMKREHIVPLAPQALVVLKELYPFTRNSKYVFPNPRSVQRCMSENALLAALRRMGYEKTEMTPHGFRAMASTLLHEQGWPSEIIEIQLAHSDLNKVRESYNHARYLVKRREMMIAWANYLDKLTSQPPIRGQEEVIKG